jgi:hypothetical protein
METVISMENKILVGLKSISFKCRCFQCFFNFKWSQKYISTDIWYVLAFFLSLKIHLDMYIDVLINVLS